MLQSTQFLVSSTPPAASLLPLPASHSILVHIIKSNSIFIQFKSSGLRYKVSSLLSHWVHISSNWCWLRFQCFACFKQLIPTKFYFLCTSKCGSLESYLFFLIKLSFDRIIFCWLWRRLRTVGTALLRFPYMTDSARGVVKRTMSLLISSTFIFFCCFLLLFRLHRKFQNCLSFVTKHRTWATRGGKFLFIIVKRSQNWKWV